MGSVFIEALDEGEFEWLLSSMIVYVYLLINHLSFLLSLQMILDKVEVFSVLLISSGTLLQF